MMLKKPEAMASPRRLLSTHAFFEAWSGFQFRPVTSMNGPRGLRATRQGPHGFGSRAAK